MVWLVLGEIIPKIEQHMIQSPKLMITVAWNTNGFHAFEVLQNIPNLTPVIILLKYWNGLKNGRAMVELAAVED
jgi:hypothetical protein